MKLLPPGPVKYEFCYPPEEERIHDGFAEADVKVADDFDYPIHYIVKFRARTQDTGVRSNLSAKDRGARVYCNQRLAAGPTLFDLDTGMHNFHAQSYMECIVHADVLDQQEADLIGTNRSALKTDNEEIEALIAKITELMKKAIAGHSKFRDSVVEEEIQNDPTSKAIWQSVEVLPAKSRKPAQQLLTTLATSTDGVQSESFQEVAPFLVKAINSSEVLVQLIKTGINPNNLSTIIDQLIELSDIERSDVLKLYRARQHGIVGLQILEERSHKAQRGPRYENELQGLLKHCPWLIRPEFGNYLSSDSSIGEVARKISSQLKIDGEAGVVNETKDLRPDLVFVLLNPGTINNVHVVELKSPNVDLNVDHLQQLEGYIMEVENILEQDYGRPMSVTGSLIGNMPKPDTTSKKCRLLINKLSKAGPQSQWEVLTLPMLLERARNVHMTTAEALEKEEQSED